MSLEEQAKRNFDSGYDCAESVLLVLGKQQDMTKRGIGSFIPRIATGSGGGIARNGDVCGGLVGGMLAISLALRRDKSDESRDPCYKAVDQFYNDFIVAPRAVRLRILNRMFELRRLILAFAAIRTVLIRFRNLPCAADTVPRFHPESPILLFLLFLLLLGTC